MVILSDILLFITTALVLSVTILGIVLRVRVDDSFTGSFLLVLVPLSLQMCLTLLSNYLGRTLTDVQLASFPYHIYALGVTIFSIILTTTILLMMSRYLIMLPATESRPWATDCSIFISSSSSSASGSSLRAGNWLIAPPKRCSTTFSPGRCSSSKWHHHPRLRQKGHHLRRGAAPQGIISTFCRSWCSSRWICSSSPATSSSSLFAIFGLPLLLHLTAIHPHLWQAMTNDKSSIWHLRSELRSSASHRGAEQQQIAKQLYISPTPSRPTSRTSIKVGSTIACSSSVFQVASLHPSTPVREYGQNGEAVLPLPSLQLPARKQAKADEAVADRAVEPVAVYASVRRCSSARYSRCSAAQNYRDTPLLK